MILFYCADNREFLVFVKIRNNKVEEKNFYLFIQFSVYVYLKFESGEKLSYTLPKNRNMLIIHLFMFLSNVTVNFLHIFSSINMF